MRLLRAKQRNRPRLLAVCALVAILAGCDRSAGTDDLELREIASPAGPGSGEPNLAAYDGRVFLSWLEPAGEGVHALRFAVRDDTTWSTPGTIAAGGDFFVNWADFPSIAALPDGRLAAHWLVRSGPGSYAYDVHVATSGDDGRTWSPGVVPHRDGTRTEHGFVSLFPWHDGSLAAVWLDGRDFAGADGHADHGTGNEMSLRFTTLARDGSPGPEELLDPRICDCCQTSVVLTARGPLAVYRDRSDEEIRDVSVVRFVDGAWTAPVPVHRDGWHITGCPVNGPSAAADGERVAVAWFSAAGREPRVNVAFSADAGAGFGTPLRVDDGDPIGRVDVVLLADGDALVSWVERVGEDAEIRLRRASPDGDMGPAHLVSGTDAARASGFPRMVRSGGELVLAWTEAGDPRRVRTAVARLR